MLHIILGNQGSGKTLLAVKMAYEAYKKKKTIYSNVALKFPYKQLDYNDIINCNLSNAFILIDEIHIFLSNRRSMSSVNIEVTDKFINQIRKQNLELVGTTQRLRKIDVKLREEIDYLYNCERWAFLKKQWHKLEHNQMLNPEIPIMIKIVKKHLESDTPVVEDDCFVGNKYFKLYDTMQIIRIKGLSA
jgi:hypothetical protein